MLATLLKRCLAGLTFAAILAASPLATPAAAAVVPTGLVLHLDASDPLANGGTSLPAPNAPLPTWKNLSGQGDKLDALSVGATHPIWRAAAGPNGTPAVELPGRPMRAGASAATGDRGFWDFLHDGTDHTVFVITRTTSADPNAFMAILDTGGASTGDNIGFGIAYDDRAGANGTHTLAVELANDVAFVIDIRKRNGTIADNTFPAAAWNLITTRLLTGTPDPDMSLHVNDALAATDDARAAYNTAANATGDGLYIGKAADRLTFDLTGSIAEVLIYDRALSPTEVTTVNAYLEAKYELGLTNIPEPATLAMLTLLAAPPLLRRRRA